MRSRKVRNEEEEGKDDGEMPERGLERKVEGRRLLRSRVHPVWINYEIGGLWISSSTKTTFCLPRECDWILAKEDKLLLFLCISTD